MTTYDQALLVQKLRRRAPFGACTRQQVIDAFWECSADLEHALVERGPDVWAEARRVFVEQQLPGLIEGLKNYGLRVVPDAPNGRIA